MKNRGFTLVEVLIVMAIIGILAVALAFSYRGWSSKYKVERSAKNLSSDFMEARSRAMQMNRGHIIDFPNTTTYRLIDDVNENGAVNAGEILPTFPKNADGTPPPAPSEYDLNAYTFTLATNTLSAPFAVTGVTITFNRMGLISAPALFTPGTTVGVIRFTRTADLNYISDTFAPDYDCLMINQTKVRMGQFDVAGGRCVEK